MSIFSRSILGTGTEKTSLSWWDYWIGHCLSTGFQTIKYNFVTWMDLVWFEDNQKEYALLKEEDSFECCRDEFWFGLNDDDVYPKYFLEHLLGLMEDVRSGKEELIPMDDLMSLLDEEI